MLFIDIAAVVLLILVNGALALSELAVVSARRVRLKAMADSGSRGAAAALELVNDPGRFLSTVQVGITLIGVLAGAVSGTTLGERLAGVLAQLGLPFFYAEPIGIGVVVVVITYFSVIIGELVPKQLALRDPERLASVIAPTMCSVSRLAEPLVALFDVSGRAVLRVMGTPSAAATAVTDEEIQALITEAENAGVIEPAERTMIARVMRLADRPVRVIMTPRPDVDMIDLDADPEAIRAALRRSVHSRLPACHGGSDEIVGVIQSKDLLNAYLTEAKVDPREHCRLAVTLPDTMDAMAAIEVLKQSPVHMGLVHDEYGNFSGILTSSDVLEAIIGEFRTDEGPPEPRYSQRADGSWLIDGDLPADEFADLLDLRLRPGAAYNTAAGFVLAAFGRVPQVGEDVGAQGWRFEVVDLDGRRIDKILAERLPAVHRQPS